MPGEKAHIALLIGDLIAFPQLMQKDSTAALRLLARFEQIVDRCLERHGGRLERSYFGRGTLALFPGSGEALRCALDIQYACRPEPQLQFSLVVDRANHLPEARPAMFGQEENSADTNTKEIRIYVSQYIRQSLSGSGSFTFTPLGTSEKTGWMAAEQLFFSASEKSQTPKSATTLPQWTYWLGLLLLVALGAGVLVAQRLSAKRSGTHVGAVSGEKSIAVLPFTSMSAGSDEFLADGIMEEILMDLGKFKMLKVISRTSSMAYRSTEKSAPEIAQDLGVSYLVEGSVRQAGDDVRISVKLLDAAADRQLWGQIYERKMANIFSIQSEVSTRIAETLLQDISPEQMDALERPPTDDLEAYNALLESRHLNQIRTKTSMEESLRRLDYALGLDPQFADALAEKAATLNVMASLGYLVDPEQANELSEKTALLAIKENPQHDIAYAALANIYCDQGKREPCETAFQIALQHNPNNALANYWYSLKLRYWGRLEEAIRYGARAAELDPLYPVIQTGHALTCIMGGRADLARDILDKGRHLFGDYFGYYWIRGYYHMTQGQYEEAIADYSRSQELSPAITSIQRNIIYCKGRLGFRSEVEAFVAAQEGESPDSYLNLASAFVSLDRYDDCVTYLREAWRAGADINGTEYNIKFKVLADHAGFRQLMLEATHSESQLKQ